MARSTFSKSKSGKTRQVSELLLEVEMSKKCTPLWCEAHLEVKSAQKHLGLGPLLDVAIVEKVHAVVARSTFPSQKCTKHAILGPLLEVEMLKKVHAVVARCHISKSNCTTHHMLRPLLDVAMSKKCTPLWCEAHLKVKMYKTPRVRTTFRRFDGYSMEIRCRKSARRCRQKHMWKSKVKSVKNCGFGVTF